MRWRERVTVRRPEELSPAEWTRWTALQREAHSRGATQLANPFLAPEFALAVSRHRPGVRVAVLAEDGEPAGFLPFERHRWGVGRALGLGLSDCQGVVHRAGLRWDAAELLRRCGLVGWEFDHLAEGQLPFTAGRTATFPSPVIDLHHGWQHYAAHLRRHRPSLLRGSRAKERRLARRVGEVRYVHDERDHAALRTLMAWKSAQYRRTGRGDRFARPWIVRLLTELFDTRTETFRGRLSVLYAGDRPVAAHFGLATPEVLVNWFPAYDPEFARFSPGILLHLRMAEAATADGVAYLDLGRGSRRYKDELKTREIPVSEGWVGRAHPVALAYRAVTAPARFLRNTVTSQPRLFAPADRMLRTVGRIRTRVSGTPVKDV